MDPKRYVFEIEWPAYVKAGEGESKTNLIEVIAHSTAEAWVIAGFRMGNHLGNAPNRITLVREEPIEQTLAVQKPYPKEKANARTRR